MAMGEMWISPTYKNTHFKHPLSIEDKIEIFYDSVMGWQLDIADQCINGRKDGTVARIEHSGFAVLLIVLSYFELIAKYQDGFVQEKASAQYFKKGFSSVFPNLVETEHKDPDVIASVLDKLYKDARCGLYHVGITGSSILLTGALPEPISIDYDAPSFVINPHKLPTALKEHFERYVNVLRDPSKKTERENFERRFDFDHGARDP